MQQGGARLALLWQGGPVVQASDLQTDTVAKWGGR